MAQLVRTLIAIYTSCVKTLALVPSDVHFHYDYKIYIKIATVYYFIIIINYYMTDSFGRIAMIGPIHRYLLSVIV